MHAVFTRLQTIRHLSHSLIKRTDAEQKKGAEHEATEAFFSEKGRARTKAQIDQREDCFVLKEGLGAAFLVEPASGTLPPWGVATVVITVFNDTPGRYTDKVDITFTGALLLVLLRLLRMAAFGTQGNTTALDTRTHPHKAPTVALFLSDHDVLPGGCTILRCVQRNERARTQIPYVPVMIPLYLRYVPSIYF